MKYADAQRVQRDTLVREALDGCNGNRRKAAIQLGVSVRTLLGWLQEMRSRGLQIIPPPYPRRRAGD